MGFSDGREKEWEKQAFVRNVIELLEINEYPVRKQPVIRNHGGRAFGGSKKKQHPSKN